VAVAKAQSLACLIAFPPTQWWQNKPTLHEPRGHPPGKARGAVPIDFPLASRKTGTTVTRRLK
jgi:hypothetical protein